MAIRTSENLQRVLEQDLARVEADKDAKPFILLGHDITPKQIGLELTSETVDLNLPNRAKILKTTTPHVYVLQESVDGRTHHTVLSQQDIPTRKDFFQ